MAIKTDIYTVDWDLSPRIITISDAITIANAQDLYDTLMFLESDSLNIDNFNIATASGKEALTDVTSVGITVTLRNARYKFADRANPTECIMGGGNVLAIDTDENKMYPVEPSDNVFADRDLSANATVSLVAVSGIAQEMMYNGTLYIDEVRGTAGQADYVGTLAIPSDNWIDGIAIATKYNIGKVVLLSDTILVRSVSNYVISSENYHRVNLNGQDCTRVNFNKCIVEGEQQGNFAVYHNCYIDEMSNFAGLMEECKFLSTKEITLQSVEKCQTVNCTSAIAGTGSGGFDLSNGNIDLSIRGMQGGFSISNSADANNISTIEFSNGKLNMQSDNTLGFFVLRGRFDPTNLDLSSGATFDLNGIEPSATLIANTILDTDSECQ